VDLKGLLEVVPEHGTGDTGSEYYIDGFAIDRYGELLTGSQQMFPYFVYAHYIYEDTSAGKFVGSE